MKNIKLFELLEGIKSLGNLRGVKFCYAINRNKDRLQKETDRLRKASEPAPEFTAYEKEKLAIFKNYAVKDDKGELKVFEGNMHKVEPDLLADYTKEVDELNTKHGDAIKAREEQLVEYRELLDSDVDPTFEFYKLQLEVVPEDVSVEQMDVIAHFLDSDA